MKEPNRPAEIKLRHRELDIQLKEIELPIKLASLGLRGTLIGALAGGALILGVALIGVLSEKIQVTGVHICIMMGILAVTITFMAAFVFQRSLSFGGSWGGKRVSISTAEKTRLQRLAKKG